MGRVPSNFGEPGDQVYLVPSNFCDFVGLDMNFKGASTLHCSWAPAEKLLNLRGRGLDAERVWVRNIGEANNDENENGGKELRKARQLAFTPCVVPANF